MTTEKVIAPGEPEATTNRNPIVAEADARWNSEPHSKWAADLERRARRCLHDPEYRDMQPQYVRDCADEIRVQRIADEYYDGGDE